MSEVDDGKTTNRISENAKIGYTTMTDDETPLGDGGFELVTKQVLVEDQKAFEPAPRGQVLGNLVDAILVLFEKPREDVFKIEFEPPDLCRVSFYVRNDEGKVHASKTGKIVSGRREMQIIWSKLGQ